MASKSNTKTNPTKVLAMVKPMYTALSNAEQANINLFKSVKSSTTANKGKSYWNGKRAFSWYCTAVRNCANSHYRIAKMANVYAKLCNSAIKVLKSDDVIKKKEFSAYDGLSNYQRKFTALVNTCKKNRNTVLTWGKS